MGISCKFNVVLALCSACFCSASAQELWAKGLVDRFSGRWDEIQSELSIIDKKLELLPDIPLQEQGGTAGYLSYTWTGGPDLEISVLWNTPSLVDMVALVPARWEDAHGLRPEFCLPNFFEIELLDQKGHPVSLVARESAAANRPVQRGFPFVYPLASPVLASGARIRCREPQFYRFLAVQTPTLALAELFCFSGDRNAAEGAQVLCAEDLMPQTHWLWRREFLVDGLTQLGLPEIPVSGLTQIGWISKSRNTEDIAAYIDIQLDRPATIDGIRLFPTTRVMEDYTPGFAWPQRFEVLTADSEGQVPNKTVFSYMEKDLPNPGQNPLTFRFPQTTARSIRLSCPKVWRAYENYPAFLALSEIQLLHGDTNVSQGCAVSSSDDIGLLRAQGELSYREEYLTDGFGPHGRLVSRREWLVLLKKRYELEVEQKALEQEAAAVVEKWKYWLVSILYLFGLSSFFTAAFLPIRYRIREFRLVRAMRQRIAGDLHDEVGSNLGSIQILTELMQKKKSVDELPVIRQIAAETITAVRDIVWLLRPRKVEQVGVVSHLRESAAIMLDSLEWTFDSGGLDNTMLLDDEGRSNLLLFYREALHNLIRHAQASEASVRLRRENGFLFLEIADNGCGIAPEQLGKDSTLRALKQRARRLRGELEVISTFETGTCLKLRIPIRLKATHKRMRHG